MYRTRAKNPPMAETVLIRFAGKRGKTSYILKLGPQVSDPPERRFEGGDEASVQFRPNALSPDCVDLTFEDGEFAIEVPREFFVIVE